MLELYVNNQNVNISKYKGNPSRRDLRFERLEVKLRSM